MSAVARRRWRIRRMRAGDESTVTALFDEAQAQHAALHPGWFRARADRTVAPAIADDRARVLVAEDERGEICGLVALRIGEPRDSSYAVPGRRVLVDDLVVRPSRRRLGCARALMAAALEEARGAGARQLVLTLWEGNAAAERLYASLGFRRISQVLGLDV
jgi:ribosomal protein S18 acetylase RimI-like enzyme